jgi:hypothetical protein
MNIDKDSILNMLRSNGRDADADQAQQDLPIRSTPTSTPGCSVSSDSTQRT